MTLMTIVTRFILIFTLQKSLHTTVFILCFAVLLCEIMSYQTLYTQFDRLIHNIVITLLYCFTLYAFIITALGQFHISGNVPKFE